MTADVLGVNVVNTNGMSRQLCEACGPNSAGLSGLDPRTQCPQCGGLLTLHHADVLAGLSGAELRALFDERLAIRMGLTASGATSGAASGVWRFRELVMPDVELTDVVSQPEGNTPLISRERVSTWASVDEILLKHEGHNPTGSFKDRGMTVAVTQARRIGARAVACASTGNTSASLAAYAALANIPGLVLVPAGLVAAGKLAQTIAYGARTVLVRGDFDDCLRLASAASNELGVYLVNSINPYRLEGQKTIIFELLQQLDWRAPQWIVLPAGNLGNTAAFGAALVAARRLGLIDTMPRLAAVQAAGAAPFAQSYRTGFRERVTVRADTIATAIRIGDPASFDRGVRAIRETDGIVLDVTDAEILEAKAVIDASGVGCEPASAASVAGVRQLSRSGVIRPGERVVAILTGHILKDPGMILDYHRDMEPPPALANRPIEIEPTLAALERVVETAMEIAMETATGT